MKEETRNCCPWGRGALPRPSWTVGCGGLRESGRSVPQSRRKPGPRTGALPVTDGMWESGGQTTPIRPTGAAVGLVTCARTGGGRCRRLRALRRIASKNMGGIQSDSVGAGRREIWRHGIPRTRCPVAGQLFVGGLRVAGTGSRSRTPEPSRSKVGRVLRNRWKSGFLGALFATRRGNVIHVDSKHRCSVLMR